MARPGPQGKPAAPFVSGPFVQYRESSMNGKAISRLFLTGLVVVLPIGLTVYLLVMLAGLAERAFKQMLLIVLPDAWYLPGMGVAAALVAILGAGLLAQTRVFRGVFSVSDHLFERVPLAKIIYTGLRDLLSYFTETKTRHMRAVMVAVADTELRLFGFISRDTFEDLPAGIGGPDQVAVYLPMSYQIGGYTVFVPRAWITPVDVSFEEGMRLALTAAVSSKAKPGAG